MKRQRLSIRARLTMLFVVVMAAALVAGGAAIYVLAMHTRITEADAKVSAAMSTVELHDTRFMTPGSAPMLLTTPSDVVIQVVGLDGKTVWGASRQIYGDRVLSREIVALGAPNNYLVRLLPWVRSVTLRNELSRAQAESVTSPRGAGLVVGFIYGQSIAQSRRLLITTLSVSIPLLLLIVAFIVWFAVGLTLSPVEAIRRRVATIAANDLTERVPETGGDDEVARLARTVNAMLNRLETSTRVQQEFVSNASHELRSPLTTLLATVERASKHLDETDWVEFTESIRREGRRIGSLVDDLFFLARSDERREELRREEVDLDDILDEEARRVRQMTTLTISTAGVRPTRVWGDAAMLRRMVRNVVDNALRFANEEVAFSTRYVGSMAEICIHDDGAGVDVATADRLFQRFVRSDTARSRASGGAGLGLPIVAEIASRHGGDAKFVPAETGSTMCIRVRRY